MKEYLRVVLVLCLVYGQVRITWCVDLVQFAWINNLRYLCPLLTSSYGVNNVEQLCKKYGNTSHIRQAYSGV